MRATGSVGVEHFFSLNTSACAASRSFAFPAREPIADEKSSDDRFDALQERELPRAHPARGPAARGWRALRPRVSRATPVTNRRQNQSSGEAAEKRRESRRQPRRRFRATPQHPGRRPHAARPAGAPGSGRTRAPTTALCEALREQVWIGAARRAETAVVLNFLNLITPSVPIGPNNKLHFLSFKLFIQKKSRSSPLSIQVRNVTSVEECALYKNQQQQRCLLLLQKS